MTNILLVGPGSVGAVYLYQLQKGGALVTAVCRSNFDAVSQHGFRLTSQRFGNQVYKPHRTVRTIDECTDDVFDFILVTTKSFPGSNPSLADMLRPVLTGRPYTAVVLAQNGIDIEEEISNAYPQNPLISGIVYLPAVQTSPGCIEYQEMLNLLELGTYPSNAPQQHKAAAERFAKLMIAGGGGAEHHNDIQVARWSKLLMNAAWNPICALSLCTDGAFLKSSDPYAHELVWGIMMDIIALANAVGIPGITEDVARSKLQIAQKRAETNTGREMSMLQDVKQGRSFEVEAIVGNAVRLGRVHNKHMVRLESVYALLKARHVALTGQP
jgi:2-dehydropantoate 2-reductase